MAAAAERAAWEATGKTLSITMDPAQTSRASEERPGGPAVEPTAPPHPISFWFAKDSQSRPARFHPLSSAGRDVITVADHVRTGAGRTRQQLARATGMGRNTVSTLLNTAVELGLVCPDGAGPSSLDRKSVV